MNLQKMKFLGLKNPIFSKFFPHYTRDFTFSSSLTKLLGAPMTYPNLDILQMKFKNAKKYKISDE